MYSLPNNTEKRLYVKILFSITGVQSLAIVAYYRSDMTIEFYYRWKWYFEYRAALLRVKYPKSFISLTQGAYDYVLPEDELRTKLENKIRAAKSMITQIDRKVQNLIDNWSELFPIEHHPDWTRIVQKKDYYRLQLNLLITEYETLTKQNYEQQ